MIINVLKQHQIEAIKLKLKELKPFKIQKNIMLKTGNYALFSTTNINMDNIQARLIHSIKDYLRADKVWDIRGEIISNIIGKFYD